MYVCINIYIYIYICIYIYTYIYIYICMPAAASEVLSLQILSMLTDRTTQDGETANGVTWNYDRVTGLPSHPENRQKDRCCIDC